MPILKKHYTYVYIPYIFVLTLYYGGLYIIYYYFKVQNSPMCD